MAMPGPSIVSELKLFLGSVQFYCKFLPSIATVAEPLHRLTQKTATLKWGEKEKKSFQKLKDILSSDNLLVLPIGLSCDASSTGIGAVLFHRYPDGSEQLPMSRRS